MMTNLLKCRLSARVGIYLRFRLRGGNPTLSDDGFTVDDDVMLDDMSDILNNAVTSILESECDMSYSDVQFPNIDANLEMIQSCVVNDSVQAPRLYEALCVLKGHINELLSEAIRQSQHLVRRICIINESIQGSENIEDRLKIRLDELTDILLLVNSDALLPNIEVSLMNSRDTILGQLGPGRETDVIIHSQLRRIRGEIERCLNHASSNEEELLRTFTTDCLASGEKYPRLAHGC